MFAQSRESTFVREYIPRLPNQTNSEYLAYADRAEFVPIVAKTIEVLNGLAFREAPQVEGFPAALEPHLDDVDLLRSSLTDFAAEAHGEAILQGRLAIAGDSNGERPFWRVFKAEQVRNWWHDPDTRALKFVVLLDYEYEVDSETLAVARVPVECVYKMDGTTPTLKKVYPDRETTTVPLSQLDEIPVALMDVRGSHMELGNPPLLGLADMARTRLILSAEHRHALYWSSMAQPVIEGSRGVPLGTERTEDPDASESEEAPRTPALVFGANRIITTGIGEELKIVESEGKGLQQLQAALEYADTRLEALGAAVVSDATQVPETAFAVQNRATRDSASLFLSGNALDTAMTQVLRWHARWMQVPSDEAIHFRINRTYFDPPEEPSPSGDPPPGGGTNRGQAETETDGE